MARHVKDLVAQVLPKQDSWKLFLLQEWDTIIGDLKIQVRLEKIQEDTLILGVSNASWMQELYCLSDMLLKKINANLDSPHVKKLRFKCSSTPKKKKVDISRAAALPVQEIMLTPAQKGALEKIEDQHLKYQLERFLIRCYREQ